MGIVQRFENRLERVVSGAFAKAFRSAVQPVEIAAALQREVDNSAQILSRDRRLVPNAFHVELSAMDFERLGPYEATLAAELTQLLQEHATEQHYVFTGPIGITFDEADDLSTGRFRVRSHASAAVSGPTPAPRPAARDDLAAAHSNRKLTTVYVDVNGTRHTLTSPGLVIGRGAEADLRISDPGVSRRHAEFRMTTGREQVSVAVVDLGSTNGTMVNGHRVEHATVTDGSEVKIGNTTMTVHFETTGQSGEGS